VENVEVMMPFGSVFANRRVLVTGHTGFKGAWLTLWLLDLGAEVIGLSLPAEKHSLFNQLGITRRIQHLTGDIQNPAVLPRAVKLARPDFVFHLAAQAIVRESYVQPRETFSTNGMGTLNLLEALRTVSKPCAAVFITTDKCYENREWHHGYREEDALGGRDPYSASKAVAELIIAAYRSSFFKDHPVKIASCRAGNVVGGGDWAKDRIVPDCIAALEKKKPIMVRNRRATRPWQHVLEPLSGYLWLAALLAHPEWRTGDPSALTSAFNFGPNRESNRTVEELVTAILQHWPGSWKDASDPKSPHEAGLLHLSIDKAAAVLGWHPAWNFSETIAKTVAWYRNARSLKTPAEFQKQTLEQIAQYVGQARGRQIAWAAAKTSR
jgi:CDP-glucose 4,6-dehydratase